MRKLTTWIHLVLPNKAKNCVCWKQLCANQQLLDNWGVSFTPTKNLLLCPCCMTSYRWARECVFRRVELWWVYIQSSRELRLNTANKSWPIWWEQIASEAASYFSCKNSTHKTTVTLWEEQALCYQFWGWTDPTQKPRPKGSLPQVWKGSELQFESSIATLVLTISFISAPLFLPQAHAHSHQCKSPDLL